MRRHSNTRPSAEGRGLGAWLNLGGSASARAINDPAEAANVLNSSLRSLRSRPNPSRTSVSKQKLNKVISDINNIEKTQKELARLKAGTAWNIFVEEETYTKFGGRWPDAFPTRTPSPPGFAMEPKTPRGNPATWSEIQEAEVKDPKPCESKDDQPPTKWHKVISDGDWFAVEAMLEETLKKDTTSPEGQDVTVDLLDTASSHDAGSYNLLASLTQTDSKGFTPVHLACVEKMPSKLTQQLFSLNKDVATMKDNEGRLPLHLAALHHQGAGVLDRLVRSSPDTLAVADSFGRSPLRYALLQAEQKRDKSCTGMDWKFPLTQQQAQWQTSQTENWSNVHLLVKTMIQRKKLLSHANDQSLVLESIQCYAPPEVVILMLTVGIKFVTNETNSIILFSLLFRFNYPVGVMELALQMCARAMPVPKLVHFFRDGLARHFHEGCLETYREMSETNLSFRDELLESGVAALDEACQDWWDRLKFFLIVSTYQGFSYDEDLGIPQDQLVHSALTIPDVPPSLIDFLLRLTPDCGLQPDIKSGALPIHLACKNAKHKSIGKRMQVFKCALEGDYNLRRKEYRGRLPLHLALIAEQPLPVIQAILALDSQTAGRRDPMTRLFPFQVCPMSILSVVAL